MEGIRMGVTPGAGKRLAVVPRVTNLVRLIRK
jgi:hypothetical protein